MSTQSQALPEGHSVPSIEGLTIHATTEKSKFAGCYPSLNPVDIYREHIAEAVGKATGIDPQSVFPKIAWTNSLDKGDLTLPVRYLFVGLRL
jgi:arginyl-tRNA synthetase